MRKLHLRFYLAIVGVLAVFLFAGTMVWHHLSSPQSTMYGIEAATGLAAGLIDEARDASRRREVVDALAKGLRADVTLYDAKGARVLERGEPLGLTRDEYASRHWLLRQGGPTLVYWMRAGRLAVRPRHHFFLHSVHMGVLLTGIAVLLALLIYPITRSITARLARLQAGVQQFGAGDLGTRVKVEGRDEVAALARSFNESAERIAQLVRAHQLLLANCSHELRTPLARIRIAVERVPATDPQISAELARNIAELDALIGEMLLASRLEASRGVDRSEHLDLLAIAAEEAAHFDLEASGVSVVVRGDSMLLRRLVRNLLENARVHGGGATDVRIEHDEKHARITVEDAGSGVPDHEHEKIFEPFYRARAVSSGAGLGLSIVRQIARAHGGAVAYAPRPGGGARFVVTLPR